MEKFMWSADWKIEKIRNEDHYDTLEFKGNLLMYGGASAFLNYAVGGTTSAYLNNANAFLAAGDSAVAVAASQTDLQAATNKLREAMDATYPLHTDGTTTSANASATWQSTFETGDANFAWNEVGLFTATAAGRMINRRLITGGTKTMADTWILILNISLA